VAAVALMCHKFVKGRNGWLTAEGDRTVEDEARGLCKVIVMNVLDFVCCDDSCIAIVVVAITGLEAMGQVAAAAAIAMVSAFGKLYYG